MGRTGRFGRLGVAVTILSSEEEISGMSHITEVLDIEVTSFKVDEIDKISD